MDEKEFLKDRRVADPYIDRRSGEDRRNVYDYEYWESEGIERRTKKDRRQPKERRNNWVRVSEWSSVCIRDKTDHNKE